ncbi:MAG: hypothetical protein R6U96_13440 [Promethearchaeia archaeon]
MVKKAQKENDQEKEEDDVEQKLDVLWENWTSRRRCERTHIPEFVRNKNKENK